MEETALNSPSKIDTRAFLWTFDSLDEDHELERFFAGLPGFRSSEVVDDPLPSLTWEQKKRLSIALMGLFDRTFSSNFLPEPVKSRRAIICVKALDPAEIPYTSRQIIDRILFSLNDQYWGLQTAEFGRVIRGWGDGGDRETALVVQAICTSIVARAQRHDDSWLLFASNELGVPEAVLRGYAAHGDSLSLAILIHITRQQFTHYRKLPWPTRGFSFVLEAASKFTVQDTSPELQHGFCALWNQIVLKVQNDNDGWMEFYILEPIRNVYIALHQDTDAAPTRFSASTGDLTQILLEPSYPLCNVPGHHPDPTPHVHDVSVSTPFANAVLHNAALVPASLASPDPPSSSIPTPLHVDENLDVPLLKNNTSILASFHPAHQTALDLPSA